MSRLILPQGDRTDSNSDVSILENNPLYALGIDDDMLKPVNTDDDMLKPVNTDNDEALVCKNTLETTSRCQKFLKILSSLTLEILMFIYMFSYTMRNMITTNMIMNKACRFRLNYSQEICDDLSNHSSVKIEVEKIANDYSMYINLLHMAPAALIMIFLGPWSDRYGRKPPLMLTVVGVLIDDVGNILNAYYLDLRLEYMLLSPVSLGLSGGYICFLTVAFSLLSEGTTKEARTIKYAFMELAFGLGLTCGSLAGGLIYKFSKSYSVVYSASAAGRIISGIWVLLVISETKGLNSTENWKKKVCDAFSCERVAEGLKVCMKERENHGRLQIWLLFGSMSCIVITYESFASIAYTYVHHQYDWDPTMYSYVQTLSSAVAIVAMVICVPLFKRVLNIRDAILGIIGTVSSLCRNICFALAVKPWLYYTGSVLGVLLPIATLCTRSILSKLVSEDELGKVFAIMSMCETLVPLVGTLAITKLFNATISVYPGSCYLVASIMLALPVGVYIWVSRLEKREHNILKKKEDESPPVSAKIC